MGRVQRFIGVADALVEVVLLDDVRRCDDANDHTEISALHGGAVIEPTLHVCSAVQCTTVVPNPLLRRDPPRVSLRKPALHCVRARYRATTAERKSWPTYMFAMSWTPIGFTLRNESAA